jgi:ribosomal protein S18 acetylase RimI-like enzyme
MGTILNEESALAANMKVTYASSNGELLDKITPLWAQLRQHHLKRTHDFRSFYEDLTFEKRKAVLLKKASKGEFHLEIAFDESDTAVGYIASTFNDEDKVGEVDSVYVNKPYRRIGVGTVLMQNTLAWMDRKGAEKKIVEVAVGNEEAFGFYRQCGFLPRKTVLEQKK